jgi:competence protein ComEA
MDLKKFTLDYLTFSRRDRIAIISLLLILSVIFFLPGYLQQTKHPIVGIDSLIQSKKFSTESKSPEKYTYENKKRYNKSYAPRHDEKKLFFFNPNTASDLEMKSLGFRDKTISVIKNYLSKGGKFRKPEDLKKVYGLFPDEYERLAPFIKIETSDNIQFAEKLNQPEAFQQVQKTKPDHSDHYYERVEINQADTTQLIALPGIGSKLSQRIINFREKLGGFYKIEQVAETFGLADSVFQQIKKYLKISTQPKLMNINTATVDEMKIHPYIKYALAKAIVAYKNEHGSFKKLDDLKNVMSVSDEVFEKVKNYLVVE